MHKTNNRINCYNGPPSPTASNTVLLGALIVHIFHPTEMSLARTTDDTAHFKAQTTLRVHHTDLVPRRSVVARGSTRKSGSFRGLLAIPQLFAARGPFARRRRTSNRNTVGKVLEIVFRVGGLLVILVVVLVFLLQIIFFPRRLRRIRTS